MAMMVMVTMILCRQKDVTTVSNASPPKIKIFLLFYVYFLFQTNHFSMGRVKILKTH